MYLTAIGTIFLLPAGKYNQYFEDLLHGMVSFFLSLKQ